MPGLNLYLTPGTVPTNGALPGTLQALINVVADYMGISGSSAFNGLNFGSSTPSPDNQSLPWFKTDASGNPVGLFSWNGVTWTGISTQTPAYSGNTNYPVNPTVGQVIYDTVAGGLVFWNGTIFTTVDGMVGDTKEVQATSLAQALLNNPGWAQDTLSIGRVVAGAGAATGSTVAHSYGATLGEESHTMLLSELVSHTHPEIYGTSTGQYQNGSQATGVYPAITPGSTTTPLAATSATGGGTPFNVCQPTIYYWRLTKVQ